jgi:hypothetical protein
MSSLKKFRPYFKNEVVEDVPTLSARIEEKQKRLENREGLMLETLLWRKSPPMVASNNPVKSSTAVFTNATIEISGNEHHQRRQLFPAFLQV